MFGERAIAIRHASRATRQFPQCNDAHALAEDVGARLARRGLSVKTLDLLIATYAIAHGARLLTADSDFNGVARAKLGLTLAR
jgi:predicted nucleic acid-binding protein